MLEWSFNLSSLLDLRSSPAFFGAPKTCVCALCSTHILYVIKSWHIQHCVTMCACVCLKPLLIFPYLDIAKVFHFLFEASAQSARHAVDASFLFQIGKFKLLTKFYRLSFFDVILFVNFFFSPLYACTTLSSSLFYFFLFFTCSFQVCRSKSAMHVILNMYILNRFW